MMEASVTQKDSARGLSLVELTVIVVIVGVLAVVAVPRYLGTVERTKASEAFTYLEAVHEAQARHHATVGSYAAGLNKLDVEFEALEYFTSGAVTVPPSKPSLSAGWEMTLTRSGASAGYGVYTVVFNQDGFDASKSTIDEEIHPQPSDG